MSRSKLIDLFAGPPTTVLLPPQPPPPSGAGTYSARHPSSVYTPILRVGLSAILVARAGGRWRVAAALARCPIKVPRRQTDNHDAYMGDVVNRWSSSSVSLLKLQTRIMFTRAASHTLRRFH